jgi:hypothetical protein
MLIGLVLPRLCYRRAGEPSQRRVAISKMNNLSNYGQMEIQTIMVGRRPRTCVGDWKCLVEIFIGVRRRTPTYVTTKSRVNRLQPLQRLSRSQAASHDPYVWTCFPWMGQLICSREESAIGDLDGSFLPHLSCKVYLSALDLARKI